MPEVYKEIHEYILPLHVSEKDVKSNEKDILLDGDGSRYVLQIHESGPEIILYSTISGLLVVSVAGLVKCIITAFKSSRKHHVSKLKLTKRRFVDNTLHEEEILEIDLSTAIDISQIEKDIYKSLDG